MARRATAALLVLAQLTLALSGCVSMKTVGSRAGKGPGGGVSLTVFADDAAHQAGRPSPAGILGELDRREGTVWAPVFRSLDPVWTVAGLPPGRYRVRLPARLDESGNVVRMAEQATEVEVAEGRVTEVQAVLDHVSTALVVVGVITVVVAAVLLTDYIHEHGLPPPPPLPPGLAEAVFYVSIDLVAASGWAGAGDRLPPSVTSHFPAGGAIVAARRPRVLFMFSEPLRPQGLSPEAVTVLGEKSGLLPGQVSYDAEHWWVAWQPRADLAPGDTFHVTLAGDGVENAAGKGLEAAVSFTFATAR